MNFGIISKDNVTYLDIQKRIEHIIGNCHQRLYSSFLEYKTQNKYIEIDCLVIDTDLENWMEQTKDLDTVLPIIFIGNNLKECYKVYEFNHISFVYKEKMNYFDFALSKAKEMYSTSLGKFYYSCKNTVYIEPLCDVLYFETDKRRTIIHRRDGSNVYTYKNMEEFVNEIKHHFIRIHKKFFINQSDFKKIKRDKVQMINGVTLTISRPYISFMNQYKVEK